MAITNATLAQQVSDLIEYWASFNEEYATWLGGTVGGGPNLDGDYPLTDYNDNTTLVACPAQLADDVSNLVTGAQGYANAASASATAAAGSAGAAATSAAEADADRLAAQAAQSAAESADSSATSAKVVAVAQANLATDRAGYAAEWANKAYGVLVSAAAGGDEVDDYSARHWAEHAASLNPGASPSYYAAISENETITGSWDFSSMGDITFKTGAQGGTLRTGTSAADKFELQAYDVDGATYVTLIEADAGNTPRLQLPCDFLEFEDGPDRTKIMKFDLSAISTLTTRTLSMPNEDVNLGTVKSNAATAFGWGDHGAAGYALASSLSNYLPLSGGVMTGALVINEENIQGATNSTDANADMSSAYGALQIHRLPSTAANIPSVLNNANAVLSISTHTGTGVGYGHQLFFNSNEEINHRVASNGTWGSWERLFTSRDFTVTSGAITAAGLTSNDVTQTARLNIIGGTSGNTHFNWSSGGENYITHGSGDFTRFRGYDGVSTYTTKMEIGDSSVVMSLGANGYLEIQGSSYVINPTGLRLGQYTSTVGYIQAPTGGSVSIWNATTAELARFDGTDTKVHIPQGTLELGKYDTTSGGKLRITGTTASKVAELICTNGNLHIDSNPGQYVYLNYYSNTAGVYIGADGGFKSTSQRSGQYGAVETVGSKGGYGGISLDGNFALMNSGSAHVGLYDDVNNEWLVLAYPNSYVRLYHNGTATVQTTSTGARHSTQGAYYHNASSSYLSGQVTFSTSAASGGTSGDIWYQYT